MDDTQVARQGTRFVLTLDRTVCCGTGACVENAPDLLQLSEDDGLAHLLRRTLEEREVDVAKAAADACPTLALRWKSGDQLAPGDAKDRGLEAK